MMSLEKWKYSYNFKQYEKIEQHLNAIVIEQQKAESIPQKLLREYYEKKNTIRQKKYTVIAHLQDLGKKHKEEIKRAKALYEEKVFELKENHRFELNENKMQVRLHLLKIKVNYEKVLKNYDHAINSGDAKAISKKEQFINDYKAYFANETLVHKNKLNDKKFKLKQKLDADLKLVKGEFLNTKEKLKSQYTDKTYSYVPLSKTNLTYKAYKKYEYREQIKVHNQELKLVKEAYLQVKQERAKEVEDIRKSASEAKSLHYAKIKEIKLENKAHYKSLSKADKAIYKANQKFVNQHEKV